MANANKDIDTIDNDDGLAADDIPVNESIQLLLRSLAEGARTVQNLPHDGDSDAFSFEVSLPETNHSWTLAQAALLDVLRSILPELGVTDTWNDLEDPLLWEQCSETCQILLEQLEDGLNNNNREGQTFGGANEAAAAKITARPILRTLNDVIRNTVADLPKPQLEWIDLIHNHRTDPWVPLLVDKPHALVPLDLGLQTGHGLETRRGTLGSNSSSSSSNSNSNKTTTAKNIPQSIVAPSFHVPHPYQYEIEHFSYTDAQLTSTNAAAPFSSSSSSNAMAAASSIMLMEQQQQQQHHPLKATWIDTPQALWEMAQRLETVTEIALDLEAHSYRSFGGLVCLMQLSIRNKKSSSSSSSDDDIENKQNHHLYHEKNGGNNVDNYLIDTLALRRELGHALASALANPAIVKILHGADHDVIWLQRDFGLYLVNLFDTGRAARQLQYASASYAHLLSKHAKIAADKQFQLADWRVRPLPEQLEQYAIQDTAYLLDLYEQLKDELVQQSDTALQAVLDVSRQICLFRYAPEPFYPLGYKVLLHAHRGGRHTAQPLTPAQERVLASLWDWRDQVGRHEDESLNYVCPNSVLVRMARSCPSTVSELLKLTHPVPALVQARAAELVDRIHAMAHDDSTTRDVDDDEDDDDDNEDDLEEEELTQASVSSAFFKPAVGKDRRGMMSPVLGTEALYQQAGWMTPREQQRNESKAGGHDDDDEEEEDLEIVEVASTTTVSDGEGGELSEKPRKLLAVHASNKNNDTNEESHHGLLPSGRGRSKSADGLATVRAARELSHSPVPPLDEEARVARRGAARIRSGLVSKESLPAVLGLLAQSTDVDDEEDILDEAADTGLEVETELEELPVPRSMREIYKISNRNRRYKKAGSPTPERGVTPTSEKEREELAKAEALLKERGLLGTGYLEESSPIKRPRTKSRTGRDSEESVPQDSSSVASKEDDLSFMKEIGWIQSKEDMVSILGQRHGRTSTETADEGDTEDGKDITRPSSTSTHSYDYSSVGSVGFGQTASSNPFFAGASLVGGPLTQHLGRGDTKKKNEAKVAAKPSRKQQERPEKKDGRTHAYRKR